MKSLKKVLAILISAVLMVTAMSVCAFADQYSDAKALNNKKTVSESIKRDVTKLYKVTTASDGEISLDWSTSMEWFEIRVIDEDGVSQKVSDVMSRLVHCWQAEKMIISLTAFMTKIRRSLRRLLHLR